jgi:hypothetical protein
MKNGIQKKLMPLFLTLVLASGVLFVAIGEDGGLPVKNCASWRLCNSVTQCQFNHHDTYQFLDGSASCCGWEHYGYRGSICKPIE